MGHIARAIETTAIPVWAGLSITVLPLPMFLALWYGGY